MNLLMINIANDDDTTYNEENKAKIMKRHVQGLYHRSDKILGSHKQIFSPECGAGLAVGFVAELVRRFQKNLEKQRYQITSNQWILFIAFILVGSCNALEFQVHPVSIVAIDGTTVEFTCTAENANLVLSYLVNNISASELEIIDKGFMQSVTEILGDNVRRRNLTVTVSSALNNNSEIYCFAVGSGGIVNSNTATLTVQGPLSSVGDLFYSFIVDSSTVNISWTPPFTLPGTYITGYNVSVLSENGTSHPQNNSFTERIFYTIDNFDTCAEMSVYVIPYNGLNGNASSTRPVLPVKPNINVNQEHELEAEKIAFSLQINISDFCEFQMPTFISIRVQFINGSIAYSNENISLIKTTYDIRITAKTIPLFNDYSYTAAVKLGNGMLGFFYHVPTNISLSFSSSKMSTVPVPVSTMYLNITPSPITTSLLEFSETYASSMMNIESTGEPTSSNRNGDITQLVAIVTTVAFIIVIALIVIVFAYIFKHKQQAKNKKKGSQENAAIFNYKGSQCWSCSAEQNIYRISVTDDVVPAIASPTTTEFSDTSEINIPQHTLNYEKTVMSNEVEMKSKTGIVYAELTTFSKQPAKLDALTVAYSTIIPTHIPPTIPPKKKENNIPT